ncbi:GatB/YqeY domain-containing protein [Tundrisphaera lichenicola]|uniref:GatB/YqeY domain-containing protein n=1 Tax=Tundrisphaera lichenicola TaxID=2029860 RepID=UPI003EB94AB8
MSIVQRMRGQLKDAMKAKDALRTSVLRYWIAQLTLGSGEEMPDADAIKKMRGVIKEAKSGQTTWKPEEVALIQEWVPPSLGPDQIAEALRQVSEQIKAAPKEGMAIGLAMKALAGQPVDSDDVRAAVASIRG